ncbi:hypothetical protein AB0383_19215 [Amycolatopsis sp. NPDC051373]
MWAHLYYLARIDTLIEQQQRLIEVLRERRRSVLAHALHEAGPRVRLFGA